MMLIAIDTETGGVNPQTDALLSISACHFDDPKNNFTVFIKPDPALRIEAQAAAVNGYTTELWEQRGAIPLREALIRFKKWLPFSGNTPLAHNATFDRQFMEAAERQANFKTYLQYRWHCSMSAMMFCDSVYEMNCPNFKLETLAIMCGHWKPDFNRGAHQSADDVVACATGYRWLVDLAKKKSREAEYWKTKYHGVAKQQLANSNTLGVNEIETSATEIPLGVRIPNNDFEEPPW